MGTRCRTFAAPQRLRPRRRISDVGGLNGDVDPACDNLLMSPPRRPEPYQVGKDHAGSGYFRLLFQLV